MKTSLLVSAAVAGALLSGTVQGKTLTIGVDVSGSSPFLLSPDFAAASAGYVQQRVMALQPADVLVLRTLGDRSSANARSERFLISKRNRAQVAKQVSGYIKKLPAMNLAGQNSTNLIAWYQFGQFDCANGGSILTLSDGIEGSSYISAKKFLAGKPLPKPKAKFLSGCDVTILGLGRDTDGALTSQQTDHIKDAWQSWMNAAGAGFKAVINP